jgi:hypothetical protein
VAAVAYSRLRLRQLEVLYVAFGQQDAEREATRIFALLHRCQQTDRNGGAYRDRDGEEPQGEVDDGRQYGDVLAGDGEHVRTRFKRTETASF